MANVKIVLIVDTKHIIEKGVKNACEFIDNTEHKNDKDPDKYKTYIRSGQMIEWSGIAKDPRTCDLVSIDSISIVKNKDLFGIPILIGRGGIINANILANESNDSQETYILRFTVITNKNGSNDSYEIDPVLRVKS